MATVSVSNRLAELRQKIAKDRINMIDVQMMKTWIKELEAAGEEETEVWTVLQQAQSKINDFVNR